MTPTGPDSTALAAPGARSFSRADILELGRAARPWEFLPLAARALAMAPGDVEIRFLAAANLGQLGLGTLARIQLEALPVEAHRDSSVRDLLAALARLAPDEMPPGWLVTTCGHNLVALQARGQCVGIDTCKWTAGLVRWRFCRAIDGNIVRAPGNEADLSRWGGLLEQVASARSLAAANIRASDEYRAPITLEGIDPPWQFIEVSRAAPPSRNGYQTPILVVQADESEFLDGLAQAEMTGALAEERTEFFVGARAAERLAAHLESRCWARIDGPVVSLTATRTRLSPTVREVMDGALRKQKSLAAGLAGEVKAAYSGRDAGYWRERYRSALNGSGQPLRVLIPTCRYSTYVVHASSDLAAAVQRAGHRARVLVEPDAHSTFSGVAYHRALAEFDPDLVVLVNYPRASMPGAFPANIPYVAWLQDPMPHLFDTALGRASAGLDFLAGCLFPELFERFEYPAQRVLPVPVVACASKFSGEPAGADLRSRHECEIAYVSHHSQSAEALHATLRAQAGAAPAVQRAFDRIFAVLPSVIAGAMEAPPHTVLAATVREHARLALGAPPDDRTLAMLLRNYALAGAERMFRHEALGWAAEIAARRGWRLNIYGKGWEQHPALAPLARGELTHGEELRASYQSARVHLHVSLSTLVHQRVLECALSGGFPLCRMHRDAISGLKTRAQLAALGSGREPAESDAQQVAYPLADHAEGLAMAAQLQRLGYGTDGYIRVSRRRAENLRRFASVNDASYDASWLLGDLAGTTFWDRATLEERLERAILTPSWRDDVARGIGSRVRGHLTHDAFLRRLLGMVAGSLGVAVASPAGTGRLLEAA